MKKTDETRKCFYMVGGTLIEQKVKEVIVDLEKNHEMVSLGLFNVHSLMCFLFHQSCKKQSKPTRMRSKRKAYK